MSENPNLPFLKKLFYFICIILTAQSVGAQDLIGKITDVDSAHSPLFLAEVVQMQNGKTIATYKTYFDGTYRLKVKPDQTYQLKVSFPGRADTTVTVSVDKHGTLYSGTLFISLFKDGLRLTGYLLDQIQDIPIPNATIILRNVMTRKEDRVMTDGSGSYNLKMDYETNYTLKVDKMSTGILNKYQDTSFNISTIGFNKPLDFRLDIKLGPTNGYTAPRSEYDPFGKGANKNLKPVLEVIGVRDSAKRHEQDSVITALHLRLNNKDSLIASLDQRINDINKTKNEPKVILRDMDPEERKKEEDAKLKQEVEARKNQLMQDQKKKDDLAKAESDVLKKKQAEKDLQDKLDKENKEAQAKQQKLAAEREANAKAAAKVQAEEDSLLRIAKAKNNEILARRKHVLDSINTVESKKALSKTDELTLQRIHENDSLKAKKQKLDAANQAKKGQLAQDSLLKIAEASNKNLMANRKRVLDSLINIESQKTQVRNGVRGSADNTNQRDSSKIREAQEAEMLRQAQRDRYQAEQDSLLRNALEKNKEIMARRKKVYDSIAVIEKQEAQARNDAKKQQDENDVKEKARLAKEQTDKIAREKEQKEAEEKLQAEITEREKKAAELALLRKVREDSAQAAISKSQQEDAARKSQIEQELAAMKKAREDAEAKLLADKREKEAADKAAKKESKRLAKELADQNKKQKETQEAEKAKTEAQLRLNAKQAEIENEQRELEAKKTLEEQEKNKLKLELGKLQKDEESSVTKDQDAKRQDYNPDQALKADQARAVNAYQTKVLTENKRRADSLANPNRAPSSAEGKLIRAKGFVKNGQTEEPISNVSINIRRLNSIVSQEVTSDAAGKYDILLDSGYFYLVSFYKDKYEISKQILDLTTYRGADYNMVIQYLKERDDFDPTAKMPIIQFQKNSSKLPADVWTDLQTIVKMMKDIPELKIKLYGLGSLDEDYPMELSVTRARLVADLMLESGIKPSRIRINGIGAYRPRSGCTEGKACTDANYKMDRVVMYRVVKE